MKNEDSVFLGAHLNRSAPGEGGIEFGLLLFAATFVLSMLSNG